MTAEINVDSALRNLAIADPLLKIALSLGIRVALLAVGYCVGDTALAGDRKEATEEPTGETLDH